MAASPAASGSSTSGSSEEAPPPSLSWQKCSLQESDIQDLVERGLLPEKQVSRWRCCYGEEFSSEDTDQTVVFKSFYEKGFGLPAGAFFRGLLHFYGLEVAHLKPNLIAQIAIFIHLCEGYLGIEAHWDLWIHLFRGELFVENVQGQPKRFACAGGLMLHLRPSRKNLYIPNKMTTNNAGWTRGWFYLRNFGNRLPAFTNKVLRERPAKWDWGVSPPAHQARLEVLTEALVHLARKGLMATSVIANFHRQRVIPLTERSLLIFGLTPGVPAVTPLC